MTRSIVKMEFAKRGGCVTTASFSLAADTSFVIEGRQDGTLDVRVKGSNADFEAQRVEHLVIHAPETPS